MFEKKFAKKSDIVDVMEIPFQHIPQHLDAQKNEDL